MSEHMADPVAELYAVLPSAFTRERNAKAAALKKAGRDADARAVQQLRRPPASLWATNQLARAAPKQLEALIDAADRARGAQLRDPRAAGEAVQRLRADLEALVARAGQLLTEHDHRPTPATLRRISDTLMGAAADPRLAQDLRHGRLTTELAPPGFEILAGADRPGDLRIVQGGKAQVPPPARQGRDERRAQAEEERRLQQQRQAEELEREAAAHAKAAAEAEREAAELADRLAAARQHLREARRAATAATAAGRKARRTAK